MKKSVNTKADANSLKKVEWVLRIGIFGSFLGHGIFALGVKESWFKYFTAVGISQAGASQLLNSQALGGKGAQQVSTETIVLITPLIMNGIA